MGFYEPFSLVLQGAQLRQQFRIEDRLADLQAGQVRQMQEAQREKWAKDFLFEIGQEVSPISGELQAGNPSLACWQAMTAALRIQAAGITAASFSEFHDKQVFVETTEKLQTLANAAADNLGPDMAQGIARLLRVQPAIPLYRKVACWMQVADLMASHGYRSTKGGGWWIIAAMVVVPFALVVAFSLLLTTPQAVAFLRVEIAVWLILAVGLTWRAIRRGERHAKLFTDAEQILQPVGDSITYGATIDAVRSAVQEQRTMLERLHLPSPATSTEAEGILSRQLDFIQTESARHRITLAGV